MNPTHLQYTNLTGIPTAHFASPLFNERPIETHINGVREMNSPLFATLDRFTEAEAPHIFMEHMKAMFSLDEEETIAGKKCFKANYLRLLRGWFFDSNRPEGAVMKGWAESRFGLMPLFHGDAITDVNCRAYWNYISERMHPRFNNNAIFCQFDILYEFAQYFLKRFERSGPVTLYRGLNISGREDPVIQKTEKRRWIVRNNSLVSYTACRERASEFGDIILMVEVPFEKTLCFPKLLPGKLPAYENEYIILGGDYISTVVELEP
ncbi:MAG: NAD(+)--dinitrogen-reductase ADP-D-ribosyltransferase [Deltaproteobacteria bacterium]|nr:NAD(+)--dinitrogen-reductase ADP-D-ribosyltransferase [Deltaproteobacteria bacterium]